MIGHLQPDPVRVPLLELRRCSKPTEPDEAHYRELLTTHIRVVDEVVNAVARRHRLAPDEREELGSLVRLKLVDRHYYVLRQFQGRSSFKTYLTRVVSRLSLDSRTERWGKWHASAAARRAGRTAMLLEQLIVRDGLTFEEAYEVLRTNHAIVAARTEIEAMYARLPLRSRRRMVSDQVLMTMPASEATAHRDDHDLDASDPALAEALARSVAALSTADRHLLTLRYREGWTVRRIAQSVGVPARTMYRMFERIQRGLRRSLMTLAPGT